MRRPWKFGRFKENSRCIRCGRRLEVVAKICDSCVVEMHVESILTNTPLVEITKRYDIYYTTVLHKLGALRNNGKYQQLFFKAVEKFRDEGADAIE
jgi:hypothetical protein